MAQIHVRVGALGFDRRAIVVRQCVLRNDDAVGVRKIDIRSPAELQGGDIVACTTRTTAAAEFQLHVHDALVARIGVFATARHVGRAIVTDEELEPGSYLDAGRAVHHIYGGTERHSGDNFLIAKPLIVGAVAVVQGDALHRRLRLGQGRSEQGCNQQHRAQHGRPRTKKRRQPNATGVRSKRQTNKKHSEPPLV